jgi:hypothetical protein
MILNQIIMKNELNNNVSSNQKKKKYVNALSALGAIVLSCLFYEMKNKEMYAILILPLVFLLYSLVVHKMDRGAHYLKNTWPVWPVFAYIIVHGAGNNFDWAWLLLWRFWFHLLIIIAPMLLGYFIGFCALKWKVIQKKYLLTMLTIVSFALAAVAILIGWKFQFFAVGFIYLAAPCLAYYYITQKKYVAWIIILPFVLLYSLSILIGDASTRFYPTALIPIVSASIYCLIRLLPKPVNWVLFAGYVAFLLYMAVTACSLIFFSELMHNYATP